METTKNFTFVFILFVFFGCGNEHKSPQNALDTIKTESVPNVDLHDAVINNNLDEIREYIKEGFDIDVLEKYTSSTPLITAAVFGRTEAARILIEAGSDINYKNSEGSTALLSAALFGYTDIVNLLIDAGADLNRQNNLGATALHTAAFFCHKKIVNALLKKGADKNIKNKEGKTALEIVEYPFEDVKSIYDTIWTQLKPLGLKLDYDHIKSMRPKIAKLLK